MQALEAAVPACSVLYLHGPGGIGKSTLLERLADEARARGVRCVRVDAREIARGDDVLRALGVSELGELAARTERFALFVDTYEELASLDDWVRGALLPALPEYALLVIAGREPPRAVWRADPGIAELLRVRALRNLGPSESDALLAARGVRPQLFASAHALTHGHPLALALVASLLAEGAAADGAGEALPALTPDVVRALLERILRAIPEPERRAALEIAAHARVVDEATLAELGVADARGVFAWLRALSFVHESPEGVALHDLVRDVIAADLAMRDRARERAVRDALAARRRRLAARGGRDRERAFFDELYALRRDPRMGAFFDWERGGAGGARPLHADELEALLADVARHEGEASVGIARHWWARQPEAFHALLDAKGAYVGALVYLRFERFEAEDLARDPGMARVVEVAREAPLREGEHVRVLRFWIWRDAYQALGSAAHGPHSMVVSLDWSYSPGLAWCVLFVQRVEVWRPFFAQIGFEQMRGAGIEIGGRRFETFARDLRARPWDGARKPEGTDEGAARREGGARPTRIVLSQADFAAAVREALRLAARPRELAASPLLASRVLAEWAEDEAPSPEMIRELLEVATSSLADERDDRPRRCVELTYLRPAPTHEVAAERLGLSFSTYRRQLARGVERVIAYLWDREVRGAAR